MEARERVIYGVNTGFGPMVSHLVNKDKLPELQVNLIRSHASGAGESIASEFVLAAMVVRLNTLLRGFSGVSKELINQLVFFINHRILPLADHTRTWRGRDQRRFGAIGSYCPGVDRGGRSFL